MSDAAKALVNRLYPRPEDRDPTIVFFRRVCDHLQASSRVLDIGAGAGERNVYDLRGKCAEVVGCDLDPRVVSNPLLDRGVVQTDPGKLPFPDASFDVAFCVYVLEHVDDPATFSAEVARVLRPGGIFLALTPNRWHYVATIAALTPHGFHQWVNKLRGREPEDTFPTVYRLNTRHQQAQWFGPPMFAPVHFQRFEVSPNYLMFSVPTALAGVAWERTVNATDLLERFRVVIVSAWRRL